MVYFVLLLKAGIPDGRGRGRTDGRLARSENLAKGKERFIYMLEERKAPNRAHNLI